MTLEQFQSRLTTPSAFEGTVCWQAPSNIALVKYWGKHENQIPCNPSVSFTLSECHTKTSIAFKSSPQFSFDFSYDGQAAPSFNKKIQQFFNHISPYCQYLSKLKLQINSVNTFPHSSGIASSASAMAALALCVMEIEKQLEPNVSDTYFFQKASFLARLGSGSACRSIKGPVVVWGSHGSYSDLFGTPLISSLHPIFEDYHDTILLIDRGQKTVSSTAGHQLMNGHPFASKRFAQATKNLDHIISILKTGDLKAFVELVELEALTLHAMMMTSSPAYLLMKPATLEAITKVQAFRQKTNIPVCFTLDAGANVHVLYPNENATLVHQFIQTELASLCDQGCYIHDKLGKGAKKY